MSTILATNAYKAVKKVYLPTPKLPKEVRQFPILGCIKITLHEYTGEMKFTTTNLTEFHTENIPARCDQPFETCVPMRAFRDWLKIASDYKDRLELSFDKVRQILTIQTGKTKAEFKCIDAQEFPALPKVKGIKSLDIHPEPIGDFPK